MCEALESTELAGRPREYFEELKETGVPRRPREYFCGLRSPDVLRLLPHDSQLDRQAEQQPSWNRDDSARHLAASLRQGKTANGVFGAKLMWSYYGDFLELMRGIHRFAGMGDGSLLNTAFPGLGYVFISRSDKVRQAVSLWRALQAWEWRNHEGSNARVPVSEQRSVYSFDAIDHLLDRLRRHEDTRRGFFFRIGQRPLAAVLRGHRARSRGLGRARPGRAPDRATGAPRPGPQIHDPPVDELSESWVQRYLEDVSRR